MGTTASGVDGGKHSYLLMSSGCKSRAKISPWRQECREKLPKELSMQECPPDGTRRLLILFYCTIKRKNGEFFFFFIPTPNGPGQSSLRHALWTHSQRSRHILERTCLKITRFISSGTFFQSSAKNPINVCGFFSSRKFYGVSLSSTLL